MSLDLTVTGTRQSAMFSTREPPSAPTKGRQNHQPSSPKQLTATNHAAAFNRGACLGCRLSSFVWSWKTRVCGSLGWNVQWFLRRQWPTEEESHLPPGQRVHFRRSAYIPKERQGIFRACCDTARRTMAPTNRLGSFLAGQNHIPWVACCPGCMYPVVTFTLVISRR